MIGWSQRLGGGFRVGAWSRGSGESPVVSYALIWLVIGLGVAARFAFAGRVGLGLAVAALTLLTRRWAGRLLLALAVAVVAALLVLGFLVVWEI